MPAAPAVIYFAKSFGAYVYDDLRDGLESVDEEIGHRQRMTKAFARDGAFADDSLFDPRRVTFTGLLTGAAGKQDAAPLRAAWDGFRAAHAAGPTRRLQIDSDRYLDARVETISDKFDGLWHEMTVSFMAFDPFWYGNQQNTLPLTVNGNTVVSTLGTAYSWPVFSFVVSAAPAGSLLTLANAEDTLFSFAPPAAGTFAVDCGNESITDQAGADQFAYMSGDLPVLVAGNGVYGAPNTLTLTASGGAAISSASVSWQDRWA